MGVRQLTRWQKASALVPMSLLVAAWGVAMTSSGLATASHENSLDSVPHVPATAFEQPASVQDVPAGIDDRAGVAGAIKTLSTAGIPNSALTAYRRAEVLLNHADASCKLSWTLVAAIGRVESNHGRSGGNSLDADGIARPGIYGVALDGKNNRALIRDTDGGKLDNDPVYDRAVGPMQFIPESWSVVGVDVDGDGVKNPQSIHDAAAAAAVYLCAGKEDLSTEAGQRVAVHRYNHSEAYVDSVIAIAERYRQGEFSQVADGVGNNQVLTSRSLDQTLSKKQRRDSREARGKTDKSPRKKSGAKDSPQDSKPPAAPEPNATPGEPSNSDPMPSAPGAGKPEIDKPGASPTPSRPGTLGAAVGDAVNETPLAPITEPVTEILSHAEANLRCLAKYPLGLPQAKFKQCVKDLTT